MQDIPTTQTASREEREERGIVAGDIVRGGLVVSYPGSEGGPSNFRRQQQGSSRESYASTTNMKLPSDSIHTKKHGVAVE